MRTIVKYFITFEFTSRQELHHEVEVGGVLEAVEHLDHPLMVRLHQDVPLRPHVLERTKKQIFKRVWRVSGCKLGIMESWFLNNVMI